MPPNPDSASLDAMLGVLTSSYRRRILQAVADRNPRDETEFTPDEIAGDETDGDQLEERTNQLRDVHLPRLAGESYIEWDSETETIRRGPNFDDIEPLLDVIAEYENSMQDGVEKPIRECEACGTHWNVVYLQDGVCTTCRGE